MVDSIGNGSGALAREAILAAMKSQADKSSSLRKAASALTEGAGALDTPAAPTSGEGFAEKLREGLGSIDQQIKGVDDLPRALISGEVTDLHEVAAQIKKAEFTFKFAMEMRNKLIDSYREVMRMNV